MFIFAFVNIISYIANIKRKEAHMLLTTALAIAAKVAAKAVIGNAIKELICTGETNAQALEWAVDKLGNDNGHCDIDDITTIGSDLWDFITDVI